MARWLRQTDTLVIITLAIGVFLFRFGAETWAAVTPTLVRVQNTLSAQVDRVTTSLASIPVSVETDDIPVTTPVSTSPGGAALALPFIAPGSQTRIVVEPSCGFRDGAACHY